jgi:hypothetical protein
LFFFVFLILTESASLVQAKLRRLTLSNGKRFSGGLLKYAAHDALSN